ncbi:3'-5' exonuclease [Nereida sp. MMG025]|uniref:3'-5' exonuclease n=1 Tax=Nereida sp. MMG025 TaxID=2909981 RepID=UPI001F200EE5|nr:3'-5' exonuclease [Nereida sp. MMG025]MCF6443894.1 3'-5' exonuclease [Nereida sp. MMG025]
MKFWDLREAVILDCETTGLNPIKDRIVSLALHKIVVPKLDLRRGESLEITAETQSYKFNPQMEISSEAEAIHGFSLEMLKDEPVFEEKSLKIRDFIGDAPIVAHNIEFDGGFLDAAFQRSGCRPLHDNERLCTMKEAQKRASFFARRHVKYPKLMEAFEYSGIAAPFVQSTTHNAERDASLVMGLTIGFANCDIDYRERSLKFKKWTFKGWLFPKI